MGLTPQPFDAERDLAELLAFAGMCNARADGCGSFHPGDVLHFMSNAVRGRPLARHLYLDRDPAGALRAALLINPPRRHAFDYLIHPNQSDVPYVTEIVAWAEAAVLELAREEDIALTALNTEVVAGDTVKHDALIARGYVPGEQPSHLCTMRPLDATMPEATLPPGFTIRSVSGLEEADAICALHAAAFGSHWPPGAYQAVMRTPGFHIDRELVVVAPDGRLAAFLIYWLDPISRNGLFEPVGCHPDFQRRGLTKALMYAGMRRLVAAGMTHAIVLHEHPAENPASAALYRSVGFTVCREITEYTRQM